jgi:3-hydroxyacyl-CoA dehydrogenase
VVSGDLESAAVSHALSLISTGAWRRTGELAIREAPANDEARKQLAATVLVKTRGQHAPQRIVEAVFAGVDRPFAEALTIERRLFEECRADEQSAAMRHLFFAERAAGKIDGTARSIERVAVIGAGTMGAGIAIALADAGIGVVMIDVDAASLARGRERVTTHYRGLVKRGRLSADEAENRIARIQPGAELEGVRDCTLVIEAVFENLAIKREVFAKLDGLLPADALLATNTSYLDVDQIAAATKRPEAVLGLHFFSPANVMKLVEVVRASQTSKTALATGSVLARRLGKIPVIVGNATGFVGNRMLQAYGRESQLLLLEGATPWQVDAALENWGMAMGPNAVGDLAGLDIGYRARRERRDLPDDPRYFRVADLLVELGRLGQKSGRGNYLYPTGGRRQADPEVESIIAAESARLGISRRAVGDEEIVERCIYALINEGAALLGEGIAERASDIDVVWANGYGFPRFRGGPLWFADSMAPAAVLDTIRRLERQQGSRFWTPATLLLEHATSGVGFYEH